MPEGPEIRRKAFCLDGKIKNLFCEFVFITPKKSFIK
jgi:hypothetical protein